MIKLGAFAYLHKPFSVDEIEDIVDRAVGTDKATVGTGLGMKSNQLT